VPAAHCGIPDGDDFNLQYRKSLPLVISGNHFETGSFILNFALISCKIGLHRKTPQMQLCGVAIGQKEARTEGNGYDGSEK
jgi:hypothetical protein